MVNDGRGRVAEHRLWVHNLLSVGGQKMAAGPVARHRRGRHEHSLADAGQRAGGKVGPDHPRRHTRGCEQLSGCRLGGQEARRGGAHSPSLMLADRESQQILPYLWITPRLSQMSLLTALSPATYSSPIS